MQDGGNNLQHSLILKDIATIFKGRAVPSKAEGDRIAVINIVDVQNGIIDYDQLKSYDEKESLVLKYYLKSGDLLISSKGTQLKLAIFEEQNKPVVASSNFTIIRPSSKVRGYYLKLFFETETGRKLLMETDRGKSVMNLSTSDIAGISIPMIPLVKQDYAISRYLRGQADYQRKLDRANQEWQYIEDEVKRTLFPK